MLANLFSRLPLSSKDYARMRIDRNDSSDHSDGTLNYYLATSSTIVLSSANQQKYQISEIKLGKTLSHILSKWANKYNKTSSFILSKTNKIPTNIENYIARRIFTEFKFPRLK